MNKIAILVDSSSQIPLLGYKDKGVFVVPLQVIIGNKVYFDGQTEDMNLETSVIDSKTIFKRMVNENIIPKTSQPTTGSIVEMLTEIKESGYDEVIGISIATGLSSTLNGMKVAASMVEMPIVLVDSKSAARNQRYLVEVAMKLVNEKNKTAMEIKEILDQLVVDSATIIYTNNLDHLKKGGRITPAVAMLGNMFKIVPVMKLNHGLGGKIDSFLKVRTTRKANLAIIDYLEKCGVNGDDYIITIEHADNEVMANAMIKLVKEKFGSHVETVVDYLPSVVGVHMGIGGIGYQYIKKYCE